MDVSERGGLRKGNGMNMDANTTPRCIWPAGATLGEGPLWSRRDQRLYWVDVLGRKLHSYAPSSGARHTIDMPSEIGCVMERSRGGLAAMLRRGLAFIDPASGAVEQVQDLEGDKPNNRFNDGKVDASGRIWAGTMAFNADELTGTLYRVEGPDGVVAMDGPYLCPNGPAFSPDSRLMYHAETMRCVIYAFDFDPQSGEIGGKREFTRFPDGAGYPDGMTVDADGYLWVAHWGGARVTRFAPDGQVDRVIPMPVPFVTSLAFAGDDLSDLYITTATLPMSDSEKLALPEAGGLFHCRPGVRGVPNTSFAG